MKRPCPFWYNMSENCVEKLLQGVLDRLEKMEDFTLDHAPDICKEILEREKLSCKDEIVITAILCLVGTIGIGICIYFFKESGRYDSGQQFTATAIGILCLVVTFGSLCVMLGNISQLRIIKVSPKLTILVKLKKLVR